MRTLLLAAALALPPLAAAAEQGTVSFMTADGCRIEAYYSAPSSGAYVLVNAHGLGSGKYEWDPFQQALKARGWGWLSLDLRGHGGSTACAGKKADYRNFTKTDWAAASRDIEAGAAWLKKKGVKPARLVFCGASVGANLAAKAAAEGRIKPAALVLLSAGLEYAGIKTELYLPKAPKRLLFVAADNDPYAWQSAAALSEMSGRNSLSASAMDGGSGHGVNMFRTPGLADRILDWIAGK